MKKMTSRERIVTTLKRKEPDRVPLDIGGTESSGMTGIAYTKFAKHLGFTDLRPQIFDVYQQVVKIDDKVRKKLEIDTIPLHIEPRKWKKSILPDGSECQIPANWNQEKQENGDWVVKDSAGNITARMPASSFYFESVYPQLANVNEASQLDDYSKAIESFDWPDFADETVDDIAARAKMLYEKTDYAIVANLQMHLLAAGTSLRGYENFMIDLMLNKQLAHTILTKLTDSYIARVERYMAKVGNFIQVVLVNDDLGSQEGPLLSIDCYKEMILPYQKRLFEFIKKKTDAFLLMHSCGSVKRFIPYLIEAGVDALNPIQVSAAEMDTKALKREFGKDIVFWGGGCDSQRVLNKGTKKEIEEEVKKRIEDLGPGGGFVFTQVHNIQPDVPAENVLVMLDAFRKYRNCY